MMATVNFSVPEEVKEAFNKTFAGQNKSAIIARLMREAVEQAMRQQQREEAFRLLTERRKQRPHMTDEEAQTVRGLGRP
jgi:hypothetical protein